MKHLVTEIAELQPHLKLYSSFNFQDVAPFVGIVEQRYIKPAIGAEMYAELLDTYNDSISSTQQMAMPEDFKTLWDFACKAIAHLAMYEGVHTFNISIGQGGATRSETTNAKSAYQYQVEDYRRARKDHGFLALDELMQYLDENETNFPTYLGSNTRKSYKQRFIQDAATFNKFRDISESRWIFLQMTSHMNHIEITRIKSALTESRFNTIKSQLLSSVSDENLALLNNYIRPAIAHLAFADAIIDLAISVDDRGVTIYNAESSRGTIVTYKEAPGNYMFNLRNSEIRKGEYYLTELEKVIKGLDSVTSSPSYLNRSTLDDSDPGFAALS